MSSIWDSFKDQSNSPEKDLPIAGDAIDLPEDVYAQIVRQVREICDAMSPIGEDLSSIDIVEQLQNEIAQQSEISAHDAGAQSLESFSNTWSAGGESERRQAEVPDRRAPETIDELGVSPSILGGLLLKFLFLSGVSDVLALASKIRLPRHLVAEVLQTLVEQSWVEVTPAPSDISEFLYQLTALGQREAQDRFARCRYLGPAPVSLRDYAEQAERQCLKNESFSVEAVTRALESLVQPVEFIKRLGMALNGSQSLLLYGDSGNGKTATARLLGQVIQNSGRSILVPYALAIGEQIVSFFDAHVHRPVPVSLNVNQEYQSSASPIDERWRRVQRPFATISRNVSDAMLQPASKESAGFYIAPLAMKLNGGMILVDDWSANSIQEQNVFENWLNSCEDGLTLQLNSGKRASVPFDVMTVVTTRQGGAGVFDDALLRRLRLKIGVGTPSEVEFREIFRRNCSLRGIHFDDWIVSRLITECYNMENPPKRSDSRDLLDLVEAICRLKGLKPHLSQEILDEAFSEHLSPYRMAG